MLTVICHCHLCTINQPNNYFLVVDGSPHMHSVRRMQRVWLFDCNESFTVRCHKFAEYQKTSSKQVTKCVPPLFVAAKYSRGRQLSAQKSSAISSQNQLFCSSRWRVRRACNNSYFVVSPWGDVSTALNNFVHLICTHRRGQRLHTTCYIVLKYAFFSKVIAFVTYGEFVRYIKVCNKVAFQIF